MANVQKTIIAQATGLAELVLCAVWEIEKMGHGNKGVVERFNRGDSLVCVDSQHLG